VDLVLAAAFFFVFGGAVFLTALTTFIGFGLA
jgi:hypothetical protein